MLSIGLLTHDKPLPELLQIAHDRFEVLGARCDSELWAPHDLFVVAA